MAPEFPEQDPDEVVEKKQARLKRRVWRRLKEIGEAQKPKRSMNAVLEFFVEWAIEDYDQAQTKKNSKK